MDFQLKSLRLAQAASVKTPVMMVLVSDPFVPGSDAISLLIERAQRSGDFSTDAAKVLSSFASVGVAAERLLLVGVGDGGAAQVRKAIGAAMGAMKDFKAAALTVCFAQAVEPDVLATAVLALSECSYTYITTKGKSSRKERGQWRQIILAAPQIEGMQDVYERALAIAAGVNEAREWANRPANHATPQMLGNAAQALAKAPHVECDILGPKEIAKLRMGALSAVAQGSDQEARFIILRYRGAPKDQAPVVLVGKGITFDAGGISLKPGAGMDEMKFDMSGAASVLGVFRALPLLQPVINVVGLIAASENMPSGRAVKPGDVVTSMSGQTIEILNTDAEGRLVLCDALTYAERFKPRAVIDIATLTGACVIALGHVRSGLFATDPSLEMALRDAGEKALDPCWPMPLDHEYAEGLKSNFADVANVAGRAAGSITAAKFLQRFTEKYPWAHLDIAGTAWNSSGAAKGATGRPVRLLLQYILGQAQEAPAPKVQAKCPSKPSKATGGKRPKKAGK